MGNKACSRRDFLLSAASLALLATASDKLHGAPVPQAPQERLTDTSLRIVCDFNLDWKFLRRDVSGAQDPSFDDSAWSIVSTPHTFNDVDSFRQLISHSGGDRGTYKGIAWYRKKFSLPKSLSGRKLFLEFEGMRQAGVIYVNGKEIGLYENGVSAYGVDISNIVSFSHPNAIAVRIDSSLNYIEEASGTTFEWNTNAFNPDFGGINQHVWLHVTRKIYQTLPIYYGLSSRGVYVYGTDFDISNRKVVCNIESHVRNETNKAAFVSMKANVVGSDGVIAHQIEGRSIEIDAGGETTLALSGQLSDVKFWNIEAPNLYEVRTLLSVDGEFVDEMTTTTGFRKTEFKGGVGTGGLYINEKFVYLKGYAQRSTNEWAGLGQAYPDWMHDYTINQVKESNANYIRWMHVSPQKVDVDSCAKYGIVCICPAGDKEGDVLGRKWEQRLEVMRNSMIYFRNNPSVVFWEAGNSVLSPEHMVEMVKLRKKWDPNGGRAIGCRGNSDSAANIAVTPFAEYYGVMVAQDPRLDNLGAGAIFRGYSTDRRNRAPIIEAEDFRDEGARRYWDNFSPPYFGFKKGPHDTYQHNSETFAIASIERYWDYYQNRVSNEDPSHSRWSGYASIYFSDSDADGRQMSSEVCRVSGKVDAVRLPKEIYYTHQVMQSEKPALHILGHWSYPGFSAANTVKTVFVVANTQSVELVVNGKSVGVNANPVHGFLFAFSDVTFEAGQIRAVGRVSGAIAVHTQLVTAGPAESIKLTPTFGPSGFLADGQDVVFLDVEVVDTAGLRVPTDDDRIDFNVAGPCIWRGGYNSGKLNSTNNLWLNTECGINRVSIRSTRTPGTIIITASRPGLKSVSVNIVATQLDIDRDNGRKPVLS